MQRKHKIYKLGVSSHSTPFKQFFNSKRNQIKEDDQQVNGIKNIFQSESLERLTVQDVNNIKPYSLVGKKQVQSYYYRLSKKKSQCRTDSIISLSKRTNSIENIDKLRYLTKENLLLNLFNIEKQKSKAKKGKDKLDHYIQQWNSRKLQKKGFTSIYQHVDNYRQKPHKKEGYSVYESLDTIINKKWPKILRENYNLNYLSPNTLIAETISKQLVLKSKNKLQKQINWLNEKQGYVYEKLQGIKNQQDIVFKSDKFDIPFII